jgi:threonine dehydratase
MITFDDVLAARERLGDAIYYSPCPQSISLSQITGCDIYCKMDYLQRTGSFKDVVMPRFAPLIKITNCEKMGAKVLLHGETFAEAHRLEEQRQLAYVHGFNDPAGNNSGYAYPSSSQLA